MGDATPNIPALKVNRFLLTLMMRSPTLRHSTAKSANSFHCMRPHRDSSEGSAHVQHNISALQANRSHPILTLSLEETPIDLIVMVQRALLVYSPSAPQSTKILALHSIEDPFESAMHKRHRTPGRRQSVRAFKRALLIVSHGTTTLLIHPCQHHRISHCRIQGQSSPGVQSGRSKHP